MLPNEDLCGPNKDLKRAGHVEDLGAGRGQKYDRFGATCTGERLSRLPHDPMLMSADHGSNDKRASFSAMFSFTRRWLGELKYDQSGAPDLLPGVERRKTRN
jgi:hypothetical protein